VYNNLPKNSDKQSLKNLCLEFLKRKHFTVIILARTQGTCLCWKKTWDGNVHEILIISSSAIEVSYNTNYYKTNWFDEHHVKF
jgi:hypothetical protein